MTLFALVQKIPDLIVRAMKGVPGDQHASRVKTLSLGRFHLGMNYDMLIWLQNSACRVFPCQQENEIMVKRKDKASGGVQKEVRKSMVDIYLVVTEQFLLMLKTDTKIKNVAKLLAWASLPSLEKIKHSLTAND